MAFEALDWIPLLAYFALLGLLTFRRKYARHKAGDEAGFLLSGRRLTLPAFVATLVATWYGGILGVGEFTYLAGISQWLMFAFPYYVFAVLYALFLAGKIRQSTTLTLPEALTHQYGPKAGLAGSLGVFLLVNPAPYILMLGVIAQLITGAESWFWFAAFAALFSAAYVSLGGFASVVRTDLLQLVLMYGGFVMLLVFAWTYAGSPAAIWPQLPESHTDLSGGFPLLFVLVWFFIAMWTFVDPGFHQRSAAAATPAVARRGILISVVFWAVFDMLTVLTGLYAVVVLGSELANPTAAYPELAALLLPAGLFGLFITGLVAVIMSTLDSFLFIAGQTLGRDVMRGAGPVAGSRWMDSSIARVRAGTFIAAFVALVLSLLFPSVIELWYVIGSLVIPALLLPVLGVYLPFFRLSPAAAFSVLVGAFSVSFFWMMMGIRTGDDLFSYAWLGVEPFYPGLAVAILIFVVDRLRG